MDKFVLKEWRAIANHYGYDIDDSEQGVWRLSFSAGQYIQIRENGNDFFLSGTAAIVEHLVDTFHSLKQGESLLLSVGQVSQRIEEACKFVCGAVQEKIQRRKNAFAEKLKEIQTGGESEVEILTKCRIGQDFLREELLLERVCCEVSGISDAQLLWVSHIKDWAESNDEEKYDDENVLLLARNWDALFDKKYISFDPETGKMVKAERITEETLRKFGVPMDWKESVRIPVNTDTRREYLKWHNQMMKAEDRKALATRGGFMEEQYLRNCMDEDWDEQRETEATGSERDL